MKTDREYASLDDAIRARGFPDENVPTYRRIVETVPVGCLFEDSQRGVRLVRSGDGPDLWITYGHASGFLSEDEARRAAPGCSVGPTIERPGEWTVILPKNRHRYPDGSPATTKLYGEVCPDCFMERSLDGSCGCS